MVKIQVRLKICSFHRRIQWWNSFCPTRTPLARRAKNVSKISAQLWSPRAGARWPKLCTYFRDIFGSPGQGGPSWAKWVSPLNSSMKTTNFKPNLYFYHRIPLSKKCLKVRQKLGTRENLKIWKNLKKFEKIWKFEI